MFRAKAGRGRPRKFGRAARPVTLTLPHDVIERLSALDMDLGRAVVGIFERDRDKAPRRRLPAEVASWGSRSVILVEPVRTLARLRGIQLVPVSDGKALIALEHANGIPQFELDLRDALENASVKGRDRSVLESVAEILREARLSHRVTVVERSIIVFEARKRAD